MLSLSKRLKNWLTSYIECKENKEKLLWEKAFHKHVTLQCPPLDPDDLHSFDRWERCHFSLVWEEVQRSSAAHGFN